MLAQMTFNIPPSWPVFVLDDSEDRLSWFRQRISNFQFAKTSAAAIDALSRQSFKVVSLDHDPMIFTGWMPDFPIDGTATGKQLPDTSRPKSSPES